MLSAGFQTLSDLKARLVPEAAEVETEWDAKLAAVGKGVAGAFDRYCGRTFERGTGVVEEYEAQATAWTLMRYPVESIAAIALVESDGSTSAIDTDDALLNARSGIVEIADYRGSRIQRIRITYTGGYWLDDGGSQPSGSTPLPWDVLEAWVQQVQHAIEAAGLFGDAGMRPAENTALLAAADLTPFVRTVLSSYRRYGMA